MPLHAQEWTDWTPNPAPNCFVLANNPGQVMVRDEWIGVGRAFCMTNAPVESAIHAKGDFRTTKTGKVIFGDVFSGYNGDWIQNSFANGGGFGLSFHTASTERMRVFANGHIAMNTTVAETWLDIATSVGPTNGNNKWDLIQFGRNNVPAITLRNGTASFLHLQNDKGKLEISNGNNPGESVQMTIDPNGFVGINTETPDKALTVRDGAYTGPVMGEFLSELHPVVLDLQSMEASGNTVIRFKDSQNSTWSIGNDAADQNKFKIADLDYFNFASGVKFTIQKDGNVGIGTTSPTSRLYVEGGKLTVNHSTTGWGEGIRLENNLSTAQVTISGTSANSAGSSLLYFMDENVDKNWHFAHGADNSFYLINEESGVSFKRPLLFEFGAPDNSIYVKSDGKIGLGTDNPLQDLHVDGKVYIGGGNPTFSSGFQLYVEGGILTERLKVELQSNWADYVFSEDYKLRSLGEVKAFICANGHLPNIPSAAEVEKNGIDVAEMDARLLEKIEELTLYVIALEEKNTLLTSELYLLKEQVEARQ